LVNKKIIIRFFTIFSFFSSLQGCYCFCLFKPENRLEEILEQLVEKEMGMLSEEAGLSKEAPSPTGPAS